MTSSELLAAYSGCCRAVEASAMVAASARAHSYRFVDPFVRCAGSSVVFGRMALTNLPCYEVF